jgi:N-acetyl-gamma-glutamyl-phosphate reductase
MTMASKSVGLVGARGHTGAELIRLIDAHPRLQLAFASSRELAGHRVSELVAGIQSPVSFENLDPEQVAQRTPDVCVLALPNGLATPYVHAVDRICPGTIVVDLSADYRFDRHWYYGLPELTRQQAPGQTRISNPGCYATAMQLAIAPLVDLIDGPVSCFGVSGFSGAGTTPSERNDPEVLRDNLLPYAPTGHLHEREVTHQTGQQIRFMPHVASFFRGISMTISASLGAAATAHSLGARYHAAYAAEPLVKLQPDPPQVAANALAHHATIGGWSVAADGTYAVVYATLDNLLKGAATQAVQNINLACGFEELEGIPHG